MLVKNKYKRCAYMIKQIHADIVIFLNVITETEKNMVISGEKHLGGCGKESLTCLLYTSDAADDWLVV